MKVLTYMQGGHKAVGILKKNGQEVVPVNYLGCGLVNMTEFIASMTEDKMQKLEKNAELMDGIPMEEVRLLSHCAPQTGRHLSGHQLLCPCGRSGKIPR